MTRSVLAIATVSLMWPAAAGFSPQTLNGRNLPALAQWSNAVVLPPGGTPGDALQQAADASRA